MSKLGLYDAIGKRITEGDILVDHREKKWIFVMITIDRKVYCKAAGGQDYRLFFPSVFDCFIMSSAEEADNKSRASGE